MSAEACACDPTPMSCGGEPTTYNTENPMNSRLLATLTAAAFLGSILAANAMITHVGIQPYLDAPHMLPVGFGLMAPSGVYVVGLTLVLRDLLQRQVGKPVTFALIVAGAALSAFISPALAVASGVAFLASEAVDFAVFTIAERWGFLRAVLISNAVALVVDSAVFLTLAFGSLAFIEGQIVGKAWATLAAVAVLAALRVRRVAVA